MPLEMSVRIKKQLGPLDAVTYVVGSIIGSGIFISPSLILAGSGGSSGLSLLLWLFTGLLALMEALCTLELALRVRKVGGTYIFLKESFGDTISFIALFLDTFIFRPMSCAVSAMATGKYIVAPLFPSCVNQCPDIVPKLLSIVVLCLYFYINCRSVRLAANIQAVITGSKLLAIVLIIIYGIINIPNGLTENFSSPFKVRDFHLDAFLSSVLIGMFSYGGGGNAAYAYEEYENPKRSLTIGLVVGHVIPIAVYILANVSYYSVLTRSELLSGVAVVVAFGDKCMGPMKWFVLGCVVLAVSSILNNNSFASPRQALSGAKEGAFPLFLCMIHRKHRTMIPGMMILFHVSELMDRKSFYLCCSSAKGIVSIVFILLMDFMSTLKIYTLFVSIYRFCAIIGLFRIRKTHNPDGCFKLPTMIVASYSLVLVLVIVVILILSSQMITAALILLVAAMTVKIFVSLSSQNASVQNTLRRINDTLETISRAVFQCDVQEDN